MSFLGVTFSGLDETADATRLREIRSLYFTVEWGLCLELERQGREPRFPDLEWMHKLPPDLNLAAQLWGRNASDFLRGNDAELLAHYGELWPMFRRVQINVSGDPKEVDLQGLAKLMEKHGDKQMIFRIRERNFEIPDALISQGVSCSILFDQSDVTDVSQKKWPKGVKRFAGCGYSGGLGPENIYKQLSPLLNAAQTAERWWVGMDSCLRITQHGQEVFSLESCKRVIREFDAYFLDYTI